MHEEILAEGEDLVGAQRCAHGPPSEPSPAEPPAQGLSALRHSAYRAQQNSTRFKEETGSVLSALQAFHSALTSAWCAKCF